MNAKKTARPTDRNGPTTADHRIQEQITGLALCHGEHDAAPCRSNLIDGMAKALRLGGSNCREAPV
jgi:hypothetical protein